MKKNNLLIRKLRIPIYRSSLWIIICPSLAKAVDQVEDEVNTKVGHVDGMHSIRAYTYAGQMENGARRFMLFLTPGSKPGEIAHECKHLVNFIFQWHGVNLSLTNDEHECHYLETIVDYTHKAINHYKKLYYPKKSSIPLNTCKSITSTSITQIDSVYSDSKLNNDENKGI